MEPSLPRKKKYPELAYRTHELLKSDYEGGNSSDSQDTVVSHVDHADLREPLDFRARSEERTSTSAKSGPRSRSADPNVGRQNAKLLMTQSYPPPTRIHVNPTSKSTATVPKATEYQSQFAWPPSSRIASKAAAGVSGAHHTDTEPLLPPPKKEVQVDIARHAAKEDKIAQDTKRRMKKTEYKAKFRPFSSYVYVEGNWKKTKVIKDSEGEKPTVDSNAWYTEVQERLKKADEYRLRAHGNPVYGEQLPQIYSRQGGELWNQARDRMTLLTFAQTASPRVPFAEEKTPRDRQRGVPLQHPPSVIPVHRKDREQDYKQESATHLRSSERRKEKHQGGGGVAELKRTSNSKSGVRPKSAEPATGSQVPRGESKSPRHHRRLVTTPPKLRDHFSDKDRSAGRKEDNKATRQAAIPAVPRPKPSSKQINHAPVIKPHPVSSSTGAVNGEDGKIWLKPSAAIIDNKKNKDEINEVLNESVTPPNVEKPKEPEDTALEPSNQKDFPLSVVDGEVDGSSDAEIKAASYGSGERRDMVRPSTLPTVNGMKEGTYVDKDIAGSSPLPEPSSGPVPLTTVRSPEEVTGVKSPDPETWTVPLETGKGLEWTDGQTPGDTPTRAKSPPIILPGKIVEPISGMKTDPLLTHSSSSNEPALKESAPVAEEVPPVQVLSSSSGRSLASDVLDRARSRLDQFWSKNK